MAGKPGRSGGLRSGAGRKAKDKPEEPENPYSAEQDPLDFLIQVMNNPLEDRTLRVRAAITAAQYMHTKKGDGGKKDERKDAADKIANGGRFNPIAPPKLVAVK